MNTNKPLHNQRLVTFESRKSEAMRQLIEKQGGVCVEAPSMQEVPLEKNDQIEHFIEELFAKRIDAIVFMTGVGARALIELIAKEKGLEETIQAISIPVIVSRGPKPHKVLKEYGIPITVNVPEPNTWREVIQELDDCDDIGSVQGKKIAVQEYGITNQALTEGLEKRGAKIVRVPIYKWSLPDDLGSLQAGIQAIVDEEVDAVLFTSGQQIQHVIQVAKSMGVHADLNKALNKTVIASIGPVCTETLQQLGYGADLEPAHSTIGAFVLDIANKLEAAKSMKQNPTISIDSNDPTPPKQDSDALHNSLLMKALRCEPTEVTPIWLMRQAGRYMHEYQAIRRNVSFLDFCKNKEMVAEMTVLAQEKLGADAAIIFSDILVIVECFGMGLEYDRKEGSSIQVSLDEGKHIDQLETLNVREHLGFVYDSIKLTRQSLKPNIPLLGFCGAPFTLASYMVEGGISKNFARTKKFMYEDSGRWKVLLDKVSDGLIEHLNGQIDAGVQAVQVFDSWVGCLGPLDYAQYAMPYSQKVIEGVKGRVPVIHFGTANTALLKQMSQAGGDVMGIDFRVNIDDAWEMVGTHKAIQGNMDPLILYANKETIRARAKSILDQVGNRPGHIFNLGHGILPETPFEHAKYLIDIVHELSQKK
ncbi:MAG: uroporphyrinogen decarboxylase [Candidatus Omnitrophota bacterium]|jgi:uroporphyrinogen decarboxylase